MVRENGKRIYDGVVDFSGGVDSGRAPSEIDANQVAFALDTTCRGGRLSNRPPYRRLTLIGDRGTLANLTGVFQDAIFYNADSGYNGAILALGGRQFQFNIASDEADVTEITGLKSDGVTEDLNPTGDYYACLFQAENYAILLQGSEAPKIYNSSVMRRSNVSTGEIPPGYIGAYIMGRIWMAKNNRTQFIASDLVGGPSGTLVNSYRDAVLKFTENDTYNLGGAFSVPSNAGNISAIAATANLDTSLGQGPVTIGCDNGVFTCNAPIDRTLWQQLSYPIQTVASLDYGPLSHRAFVNINADIWYRAPDGVRSFIIARRNFNQGWGQTPLSLEMVRVLDNDTMDLLKYCTAVIFDNRFILSCSPHWTDTGIVHRGLVPINFDTVSTMRNKSNPAWEGLWRGLNIYKVIKGRIGDEERCFAFVKGTSGLELWELLTDGPGDMSINANCEQVVTPIQSCAELRVMDFQSPFEPKQGDFAEVFVESLNGDVKFDVKFRPDGYPCWIDWHNWEECNKVDVCNVDCPTLANYQPSYRPRMRLPTMPETCLTNSVPANNFYQVQLRIAWTGKASIDKVRVQATQLLSETIGECR